MNLSVGIIGLPNVGKSTLFNALLKKQQALAANYPFATIEPNVGMVPVPDERLVYLQEITAVELSTSGETRATPEVFKKPPIKPATVEFVDIAGLVKGASQGAGLGNKFLSHIREVSVIAHVVRAFSDENVIKEGSVDPRSDYGTINTELMLADLQTVQNVQSKIKRFADPNEKSAIEKLYKALNEGKPAREVEFTDEEKSIVNQLFLLSAKPEIVVLNVSEDDYMETKIPHLIDQYSEALGVIKEKITVICAKIESELSDLYPEEQKEYLENIGVKESGLERFIKKAYETLGLISFLTAGEKEVRAWTIKRGINAQNAAGVIHTDFVKNFIRAEVVSYQDFINCGGWKIAREKGRARLEGKDYIMQDGDVVEFRIQNS